MADTAISALPTASSLAGSDVFPVNASSTTSKISVTNLKTTLHGAPGAIGGVTPSTGVFTTINGLTTTGSGTVAFGSGGTVAYTANNLSIFASTTSAQLATLLSDETGSGAAVFATSPTLVTPILGVAAATSVSTSGIINIANQAAPATPTTSGSLYFDSSNRLSWKGTNGFSRTFDGTANTASRIYILPDFAGTVWLDATTLGTLPTDQSGALTSADTLSVAFGKLEQNIAVTAFTNAPVTFGAATAVSGALLTVDRISVKSTAQAFSATTTLTFNTGTTWIVLGQITAPITFSTAGRAADLELSIKLTSDSSTRAFTFPGGWTWVGGLAPASIAGSKLAILTLRCFGPNDTDIVASYAVQS